MTRQVVLSDLSQNLFCVTCGGSCSAGGGQIDSQASALPATGCFHLTHRHLRAAGVPGAGMQGPEGATPPLPAAVPVTSGLPGPPEPTHWIAAPPRGQYYTDDLEQSFPINRLFSEEDPCHSLGSGDLIPPSKLRTAAAGACHSDHASSLRLSSMSCACHPRIHLESHS